jgi:hypothetical protein
MNAVSAWDGARGPELASSNGSAASSGFTIAEAIVWWVVAAVPYARMAEIRTESSSAEGRRLMSDFRFIGQTPQNNSKTIYPSTGDKYHKTARTLTPLSALVVNTVVVVAAHVASVGDSRQHRPTCHVQTCQPRVLRACASLAAWLPSLINPSPRTSHSITRGYLMRAKSVL